MSKCNGTRFTSSEFIQYFIEMLKYINTIHEPNRIHITV